MDFSIVTATSPGCRWAPALHIELFQSVFKSSNSPPPDSSSLSTPITLDNISVAQNDVYVALANKGATKATCPGGIPARVLKYCSCVLASPIKYLFSQCVLRSYLPKEWKVHQIVPVFRSGDRNFVRNYWSISLLCCVSKVLERIIHDKVYNFIDESFISKQQFGFVKHRSTLKQLLMYLIMSITEITGNNHWADVLYVDIWKAFDSVPHNELLVKLRKAGIACKLWTSLISVYLMGRQQHVAISGFKSSLIDIHVPYIL